MRFESFLYGICTLYCIAMVSCTEKKTHPPFIKMLLLNPETYFDIETPLSGKIKEVGPQNLWFVLKDKTGYIQVTTEKIALTSKCIAPGKKITLKGKLGEFEHHKYFSLSPKSLHCE